MNITLEAPAQAQAASKLWHAGGDFLSFRLGSEEFGIDILRVREIRSYEVPTRVAHLPAAVKGVVNLRGVIVPMIDLRVLLACERCDYDTLTAVVMLNLRGRTLGVVVDSVCDVLALEPAMIRLPLGPEPSHSNAVRRVDEFVAGIGQFADRRLLLLDIDALLAHAEAGMALLSS